ncbi:MULTISPECIES: Hsp20 family protein [Salinivibrio]|jgi:Molecular chaperone (small heat shock protein)|uniref:Heat-shock protein Hsp20 n=1 Tax=Salinivibrio kushneri TaxID=1908198 RepID=A0AB36K2T1_9GAMM|nr:MULTISPECIES: Hsp20 family protein [Salinivibrio]ODP97269.1 heat-shock protein Hsp20 [Salinivibrio sp. BNH]OOE33135.1 heat-shock protein Hsp20 [Salinivibrio kushneri]OOE33918.1 heat-shock protein Hsp20 [Salinivibrio kushneri]OOE38077.1 heat-shock protein Hsp20 [Salinivibrio kushneri]OOE41856.1 heat-shock protein Hsp20 [Salinivibrio kushneri]
MRNFDFSPLYRTAIGFDRLFDLVENSNTNNAGGFPPYNIEQSQENQYRITMAVAGFSQDEVDITQQKNSLIVAGKKGARNQDTKFLYQGIAERDFERKFQLDDHIKVTGADMENGMLHIDLVREVPEEEKPRRIEIGSRLLENAE